MGNERSNLSGLEFDEKAIEVTDFWIHHSATLSSGSSVSVFIGEPLIDGSLWLSQTPIERTTKNLMLYRHPCILKYISSWHKGSKYYLAVEDVKPLSHALSTQNTMQKCIGLHSVLKALCFLHDNASVSHNNVCIASIYVTKDGSWHLGGMEYLCKFAELTEEYLSKTRLHRYDKAIDPNESKNNKHIRENPRCIDTYAFAVLVKEVLQNENDDDIPSLQNFRECSSQLQNEILSRPKLSSFLEHEFFIHDFIMVHSFLTELPLKSDEQKISFFSSLLNKLSGFNEMVVATQLGGLLLSRMVLLDKTAQQDVLPFVLCPRQGSGESRNGLFTIDSFQRHLVPKLLQIFCVRDAQIRLLLLEHFHNYMRCFSKDELQLQILPELLVGIKDTNEHLVAMTLRALADIVPILGVDAVIGGKRAKLFNDGRPITHTNNKYDRRSRRNSRKSHDYARDVSITSTNLDLPERPSPDGEEGETSNEDLEQTTEEDLDNWEDWEINTGTNSNNTEIDSRVTEDSNVDENLELNTNEPENLYRKNSVLPDVLTLDIKNQDSLKQDDYDYFQDMEPVIQTSQPYFVLDTEKSDDKDDAKRFNLGVLEIDKHDEEGWGDDWD